MAPSRGEAKEKLRRSKRKKHNEGSSDFRRRSLRLAAQASQMLQPENTPASKKKKPNKKKRKKKKKPKIEEDEESYEVEMILGIRKLEKKLEYKVKWKNFGDDENSWEPEENVAGASWAIKQYKKKGFKVDEELKPIVRKIYTPYKGVYLHALTKMWFGSGLGLQQKVYARDDTGPYRTAREAALALNRWFERFSTEQKPNDLGTEEKPLSLYSGIIYDAEGYVWKVDPEICGGAYNISGSGSDRVVALKLNQAMKKKGVPLQNKRLGTKQSPALFCNGGSSKFQEVKRELAKKTSLKNAHKKPRTKQTKKKIPKESTKKPEVQKLTKSVEQSKMVDKSKKKAQELPVKKEEEEDKISTLQKNNAKVAVKPEINSENEKAPKLMKNAAQNDISEQKEKKPADKSRTNTALVSLSSDDSESEESLRTCEEQIADSESVSIRIETTMITGEIEQISVAVEKHETEQAKPRGSDSKRKSSPKKKKRKASPKKKSRKASPKQPRKSGSSRIVSTPPKKKKPASPKPKEKRLPVLQSTSTVAVDKYKPGDYVMCLFLHDGCQFAATVVNLNKDGTYDVEWDDNDPRDKLNHPPEHLTTPEELKESEEVEDNLLNREERKTTPQRNLKEEKPLLSAPNKTEKQKKAKKKHSKTFASRIMGCTALFGPNAEISIYREDRKRKAADLPNPPAKRRKVDPGSPLESKDEAIPSNNLQAQLTEAKPKMLANKKDMHASRLPKPSLGPKRKKVPEKEMSKKKAEKVGNTSLKQEKNSDEAPVSDNAFIVPEEIKRGNESNQKCSDKGNKIPDKMLSSSEKDPCGPQTILKKKKAPKVTKRKFMRRKNFYTGSQPSYIPSDGDYCTCNETKAADDPKCCDQSCTNRAAKRECPKDCHCGDRCENKRFQQKQWKSTEVKSTSSKGSGLFTMVDIEEGEFVIEYIGEVIDQKEKKHRVGKNSTCSCYIFKLSSNQYVDAYEKGNKARFVNHSCDPNCLSEIWIVNEKPCVGFFATKDIKKGEELTIHYGSDFILFDCHCGAENCTKAKEKKTNAVPLSAVCKDDADVANVEESEQSLELETNASKPNPKSDDLIDIDKHPNEDPMPPPVVCTSDVKVPHETPDWIKKRLEARAPAAKMSRRDCLIPFEPEREFDGPDELSQGNNDDFTPTIHPASPSLFQSSDHSEPSMEMESPPITPKKRYAAEIGDFDVVAKPTKRRKVDKDEEVEDTSLAKINRYMDTTDDEGAEVNCDETFLGASWDELVTEPSASPLQQQDTKSVKQEVSEDHDAKYFWLNNMDYSKYDYLLDPRSRKGES